MPWTNNAAIDSLRMQYNVARTAHQTLLQALIDARARQRSPDPSIVEAESQARLKLESVRAQLLTAMTKAINGEGS